MLQIYWIKIYVSGARYNHFEVLQNQIMCFNFQIKFIFHLLNLFYASKSNDRHLQRPAQSGIDA